MLAYAFISFHVDMYIYIFILLVSATTQLLIAGIAKMIETLFLILD